MAMGMISLFRTPKPKQFEYKPVFYDSRKEALKEREQQIKQELGLTDGESPRISMIRGQIRRHYEGKIRGKGSRNTNLRLVVIFIILCLIAYFLLYY